MIASQKKASPQINWEQSTEIYIDHALLLFNEEKKMISHAQSISRHQTKLPNKYDYVFVVDDMKRLHQFNAPIKRQWHKPINRLGVHWRKKIVVFIYSRCKDVLALHVERFYDGCLPYFHLLKFFAQWLCITAATWRHLNVTSQFEYNFL